MDYDFGLSRIYELVVNSDPCYAFLLDTNSVLENKTVAAHVLGHSDFFRNNAAFAMTHLRIMQEIVVIATDAPLFPHQLNRLARRASLGLGKVGSCATHGSGEIVMSFSTANIIKRDEPSEKSNYEMIRDDTLNPIFEATVEAVEEAVLNAIFMADTMVGRNKNTVYGIPADRALEIWKKYRI